MARLLGCTRSQPGGRVAGRTAPCRLRRPAGAPHVALRFSPDGSVHTCCVNDQYPLGRIGEQSKRKIWDGRPTATLRDALDDGDWPLGCQDCGVRADTDHRLQTHADSSTTSPPHGRDLASPAGVRLSNRCNLECIHYNGELSSSIRTKREGRPAIPHSCDDAFFDELRESLPHVEMAVYIGGEPFLARECRRVWDLLIQMDLRPEVHVTIWNTRVEHYLKALEMSVAVSLDGVTTATNHAIRRGSERRDVIANGDRLLAATRSYDRAFSRNHCFLSDTWHELGAVLTEGDRLDVPVHVIPVVYPAELSLFCLPAKELEPNRGRARGEARWQRPRLGRNGAAWDETVGHLTLSGCEPAPCPCSSGAENSSGWTRTPGPVALRKPGPPSSSGPADRRWCWWHRPGASSRSISQRGPYRSSPTVGSGSRCVISGRTSNSRSGRSATMWCSGRTRAWSSRPN